MSKIKIKQFEESLNGDYYIKFGDNLEYMVVARTATKPKTIRMFDLHGFDGGLPELSDIQIHTWDAAARPEIEEFLDAMTVMQENLFQMFKYIPEIDPRIENLRTLYASISETIVKMQEQVYDKRITCLYFTFDGSPCQPYAADQYIAVYGLNPLDCLETFIKHHSGQPDLKAINCESYYTSDDWKDIQEERYKDKEPEQVIVSDKLYGEKPKGFDLLWVFVPEKNQMIFMQDGPDGEEYLDSINSDDTGYIDYNVYNMSKEGLVSEEVGGIFSYHNRTQERYTCLADAIPDILNDACGQKALYVQILKQV